MHLQLEALREQRLDHRLRLVRRGRRLRRLGDDVETIRIHPARSADDLKVLEAIRVADDQSERRVGDRVLAATTAKLHKPSTRLVRLDRGDFERRGVRLRLRRLRTQPRPIEHDRTRERAEGRCYNDDCSHGPPRTVR